MLFINLGGHVGLYQRIALLALHLWVAVFALHFIIRQPGRPIVWQQQPRKSSAGSGGSQ
jgi:hypothetical protein